MSPPPATPSPRRFLTKKSAASTAEERSTGKPTSNLRFSNTSTATGDAAATPQQSARPTSSSGQFNATPKFAFARPKHHDPLLISPKKVKAVPKFDEWNRRDGGEAIEDAEDEQGNEEDDEMILETTEMDGWLPSPKRQRLSLDGAASSRIPDRYDGEVGLSTFPLSDIPTAMPTPSSMSFQHTPAPRRFIFTQPLATPSRASATPFPDDSNAPITRPAFLKPPSAPPETSEPLPEAFSPHRRGQKFLTGGMAAEVRQWIVDATQLSNVRKSSGDVLRARIMESRGSARDGVVLVRGSVDGKEVKLMLPTAGKSKTNGSLATGNMVGIKAPTWDTVVEGVTWVVAADWRVLKD